MADTLSGDSRENELNASSGDDFADPGAGLDRLFGGTGADVLRARDGGRDVVDCGPGEDLAIVDPQDTARDCETVDRGNRAAAEIPPDGPRATARERQTAHPGREPLRPVQRPQRDPLGSTIDTRAGAVNLITRARDGALLEGRFEAPLHRRPDGRHGIPHGAPASAAHGPRVPRPRNRGPARWATAPVEALGQRRQEEEQAGDRADPYR